MSLREALFNTLETYGSIPYVFNEESRIISPLESVPAGEPRRYVTLGEMASFVQGQADGAGSFMWRVTVHVQPGQMVTGDKYLSELGGIFKDLVSFGSSPDTKYWKVSVEERSSWSLEEVDGTISKMRTLLVPAWG